MFTTLIGGRQQTVGHGTQDLTAACPRAVVSEHPRGLRHGSSEFEASCHIVGAAHLAHLVPSARTLVHVDVGA